MHDWTKFTKWKVIDKQHETFLNLQTSHTFDCVFQHVKDRLEDVTRTLFDINLRDVEVPQADPSWTRTNYKPKELLEASYLPRAVIMYNIDVNQEALATIPTMERFNRLNFSTMYECCTIKQPRLEMAQEGRWYDYMKDIDFSIIGTPRYTSASIFWSVLVNEQPLAIELVRQLKFHYPLNETNPIYNGFIQINKPRMVKIPKPYLVESYLPRQLVDNMANMFQIDDNMELARILKHHSHNRLEYKVMSGTSDETYADMALSYPSPIYLTPMSIDMIENTEGNLKYYGVKIEFIVNYIDLTTFRMAHSMIAINKDNPLLYTDGKDYVTENNERGGFAPVYEANFTQMINGTTIWDHYKVTYESEDFDYEYDADNRKQRVAITRIADLPIEHNVMTYIKKFANSSKCNINREFYVNIEAKRTKRKPGDKWIVGTEDGFEIDWKRLRVIDSKSEEEDSIYIAVYINKEHYNKWLYRNGFTNSPNLTSIIGGN